MSTKVEQDPSTKVPGSVGRGQLLRNSSFHPKPDQSSMTMSKKQNFVMKGNKVTSAGNEAIHQTTSKHPKKGSEILKLAKPTKDPTPKGKRQVPDDVKARQDKFDALLHGDMQDLPPLPKSVVRIFLSSTFSDMRAERNTLARYVYPILKEYCTSLSLDFQVVDMRWGVTEDSQNDHSVEELCLQEITNCQNTSMGPNFVCILGNRYGFQLIPVVIDGSEFEMIREEAFKRATTDLKLLDDWFLKDDNAVPPVYALQPIRSHFAHFGEYRADYEEDRMRDMTEWSDTFNKLQEILRYAADTLHKEKKLSADRLREYYWSVTECEINTGILTAKDASSHAVFFHRDLTGLSDSNFDADTSKFIDISNRDDQMTLDIEAGKRLEKLVTRTIPRSLGEDGCFHFKVPWIGGGVDPITSSEHSSYIFNFCKAFIESVTKLIDQAERDQQTFIKQTEYYSESHEIIHHLQFCREKCRYFCGQTDIFHSVKSYVMDSSNRKPLVIHAQSGAGKTSIMAMIMKNLRKWYGKQSYISVVRFLGTSPATVNIYDVLFSVCGQLADAANLIMEPVGYQNMASLIHYMPRFLRRVAKASKVPVVILLDSVDQLSPSNAAYEMKWLPLSLPANVHIIVSTLPEENGILGKLKRRLPELICYLEVPVLPDKTVKEIVSTYLSLKKRSLTADQLLYVAEKFQGDPSPLFLKLLLDRAVNWHSYTCLPDMRLGDTAKQAIHLLFEGLEQKFGSKLIKAALGYISISLNGITEIEMEDVLSCDDDVLDDVYHFHDPPVEGIVRIPPLLWARIRHDLKEYLVERLSQGKTTLYWYHRQFIEVARERFLAGDVENILHRNMLEIFMSDNGVKRDLTLSRRNKTIPQADRQVTPQPMISKNRRKLDCIVHHLIHAKSEVDISVVKERVFCNYTFLSTKISSFSVQHVIDEMDTFLEQRPDSEIRAVRDFMQTGAADLRYSTQLAVHLLAGISADNDCIYLEKLLDQARKCVYSHPKPLLVPTGPCFSSREFSSNALVSCLSGCSEILSVSGSCLCTKEEGIEQSETICVVLDTCTGERTTLEQIKLQAGQLPPILSECGKQIYLFSQDSVTFCDIADGTSSVMMLTSILGPEQYLTCCNVSDDGQILTIAGSKGLISCLKKFNSEPLFRVEQEHTKGISNIKCIIRDSSNFSVLATAESTISSDSDQTGLVMISSVTCVKSSPETETSVLRLPYPIRTRGLQLSENGAYLLGISDHCSTGCSVYVVRVNPLQLVQTLTFEANILRLQTYTSQSGLIIYLITDSGRFMVYDIQSGTPKVTVSLEDDKAVSLLLIEKSLTDEPLVAVGTKNGFINFHNLEGTQIGQLSAFHVAVKDMLLLLEDRLVAYTENAQLKVWDWTKLITAGILFANTGEKTVNRSIFDETMVTAIEVSLDCRFVYTVSKDQLISVWTVQPICIVQSSFMCGMLAVSDMTSVRGPSALLLIVFSKSSESLKVFDPESGKEVIPDIAQNVLTIVLTRDLQTMYLITHSEGRLKLLEYELKRLRLSRSFLLQKGLNYVSVEAILTHTERYLVLKVECTSEDRKSIEAQWKRGGFVPQPHPYRFSAVDLTHTSGNLLHCYRQLSKIPALGSSMSSNAGNTMIFSMRRCVCFWDIPTGRCDQMITKTGRHGMFYNPSWLGGGDDEPTAYASLILQSEDRSFVVMGSDDGYVMIYRADTGAPIGVKAPQSRHTAPVKFISISKDSRWVVSICQKTILKLWDPKSAMELFSVNLHGKVKMVKFSPDSRHVTVLTGANVTRVLMFEVFPGQPSSL